MNKDVNSIKYKQYVNTVYSATLAGGCYWCLEAMFSRLDGISNIRSGFSGGHTTNPTYKDVCNEDTGHAEVINFDYDPNLIDYIKIIKIFFTAHDPTTLNKQGDDIGTRYRSAVFYHDDYQKIVAEKIIKYLIEEGIWENIVTEITPFKDFYPAPSEHDNYFEKNSKKSYCQFVIAPKIEKFNKLFSEDSK